MQLVILASILKCWRNPQGGVFKEMQVTNHYETLLVLESSLSEETRTGLVDKIKAIIEKDGTIEKLDLWGNRRLAYPIDYKTEGFYVVIQFISNPELPKELDRVYGITDGILRSMVIKRDERYLDIQVKLDSKPTGRVKEESPAGADEKATAEEEPVGARLVEPADETAETPAPAPVGDSVSGIPPTEEPATEEAPKPKKPRAKKVVEETPAEEEKPKAKKPAAKKPAAKKPKAEEEAKPAAKKPAAKKAPVKTAVAKKPAAKKAATKKEEEVKDAE
ncbi:MAG: 30S ribosomal protein S6 [Oscillospiraceae bacterium]|nr:30S ribosomal protein S6 [Oscillospiraceae bacterium]